MLRNLICAAFIVVALLLGIVCAIRVALFVVKAKKGTLKRTKIWKKVIISAFSLLLVVVIVVLNVATSMMGSVVTSLTNSSETGTYQVETNEEDWRGLVRDIADEGMILLRNENNTLPIDTSQEKVKINLLGYRAYDPIYAGSGSSNIGASDSISIIQSLEEAGFEINPALEQEDVYVKVQAEDTGIGFMSATFSIDEKPLADYKGAATFEKMKEYSDIAVVVIGRTGGESVDLTKFKSTDEKHYLELSEEEKALLQKARETFGTVVVIYNGVNAMELGYLAEYNVDACICTGIPGAYGFESLGRILSGKVNPSAKTVDTWVYDVYSNPANENFGEQPADNSEAYYVDYVENIYVGYKWYETAYAEGAVVTNKAGVTYDYKDYDSIVVYPFGYGLSYTTFASEIVGGIEDGAVISARDEITVDVKITNTGSVAGKEVAQIYLTAPYTAYDIEHGVEKSAVALAGFAKTKVLEPGESEIVQVTFSMEDNASYDTTYANADGTMGAYRLDAGDYIISLRSNAHEAIASKTVKLENDFVFTGDEKRTDDETVASNQLSDAERGIYLSRNNAFANYSEAMQSVSATVKDTAFDEDSMNYDFEADDVIPEMEKGVNYDAKGDLTLEDMAGVDYDDELWDQYIAQLSTDDMKKLIEAGVYGTYEVESVGKPQTSEVDGPLGITSMFGSSGSISYPSPVLLAASFNVDLAYRYGDYIADMAHAGNVTGWYAPAMNIHRSQFSGRNFEYYSGDGFLSGAVGAATSKGATDAGLIVYIKHFAFNDQETQRAGKLHTYVNEQAAREIYLKPFESSIKDGNANGVMSSMNYIGDVYVGAHRGLMTDILRNEWGFKTGVLSDMPESEYMRDSANACVKAGHTLWLAMMPLTLTFDTDEEIYYAQQAAKRNLYMYANAEVIEVQTFPWQIILMIINLETVFMVVFTIFKWVYEKRNVIQV